MESADNGLSGLARILRGLPVKEERFFNVNQIRPVNSLFYNLHVIFRKAIGIA